MSECLLDDRAVLVVSGEDAETLLNRLVTNSMLGMAQGTARYAALLSPQGKLEYDFLVVKRDGAFWIDCVREQATALTRKLTMFRLRSKATISVRDDLAVAASWGSALMEAPGFAYRDPRHDGLGYRIVAETAALDQFSTDVAAYEAHRIALGVPKGGIDFVYGDTFVHDANVDLLHGVDFDKGCYVGQEVVSRVHHRKSARKRIVKVHFYGDPPEAVAPLTAGTVNVGQITSLAVHEGLATARIDRLAEAEAASMPVTANETLVGIVLPVAAAVEVPSYGEEFY